jgi:Inorganic pyrophosphatase
MPNFLNLPSFTEDGDVHVVVETPRGSRAKFAYDPKLETFILSKSLLTGLTYPHDWGFVLRAIDQSRRRRSARHHGDPRCSDFPGDRAAASSAFFRLNRKAKGRPSETTGCSPYPAARIQSRACAMSETCRRRFRKSLRNSSSRPTSSRTKHWKSSGGRVQDCDEGDQGRRQEFFEGRQVTLFNISPGTIKRRAPALANPPPLWRDGCAVMRAPPPLPA